MRDELIISIVTICFNCIDDLKKTINSVEKQLKYINCEEIEYVIIDGFSSDGTQKLADIKLEKFKKSGLKSILISEKDNGIFDAINKGIQNSHGQWILILNAGDILHDEYVIRDAIYELKKFSPDVLYGNTMRVNPLFVEEWKPLELSRLKQTMIFCHQSVFIRRNLEGHCYDLQYKYCADYNLMLQLYLNGKKFKWMDRYISDYKLDGVTANKGIVEAYRDVYKIRIANGVINRGNMYYRFRFMIGSVKRYLIKLLPTTIRWNLVRLAHRINFVRFK